MPTRGGAVVNDVLILIVLYHYVRWRHPHPAVYKITLLRYQQHVSIKAVNEVSQNYTRAFSLLKETLKILLSPHAIGMQGRKVSKGGFHLSWPLLTKLNCLSVCHV